MIHHTGIENLKFILTSVSYRNTQIWSFSLKAKWMNYWFELRNRNFDLIILIYLLLWRLQMHKLWLVKLMTIFVIRKDSSY